MSATAARQRGGMHRARPSRIGAPGRLGSAAFIVSHRRLLLRVAWSDLRARYAGSILGIGWAVLAPALILFVYAAVYLVILDIRVADLSSTEYVLYVFAGLVPYLTAAEGLTLASGSIVENRQLLASTVFPIDLAPVKAVLVALAPLAVGMVAIVIGLGAIGDLHWTAVLAVPILVFLVLGLIGAGWLFALLNIVARDLQHAVAILLMILLVASPIGYTPDMVPPALAPLIAINPFAYPVVALQHVLVLGDVPSAAVLSGLFAGATVLFVGASIAFARVKRAFLDYV